VDVALAALYGELNTCNAAIPTYASKISASQGGWENEGGTTSQLDTAAGIETEELLDFV
ncbi:hypothetical protein Tco_1366730, partial [Tanacetum coccineum]